LFYQYLNAYDVLKMHNVKTSAEVAYISNIQRVYAPLLVISCGIVVSKQLLYIRKSQYVI